MTLLDAIAEAPNASQPLPWLITCGQPSADQLTRARDAGVTLVVDLRDPMEARPFDEPETLEALGVTYLNVPVNSGALDDASLEQILEAIRAQGGRPTMVHCASANRVGGALIPFFMIDQGMDEPAAIDAAMKVGLRSAELMEWGLAYARARRPT
ncbi:MAG TPA: hypothetical protein VFN22_11750 [Gemmatimonadales bacterium]|nr:hypothetical protein [Gemmatimonadales bacterium]